MQTRIHAYLRAVAPLRRDHEQIGPFLATFSPNSSNPYLSYAIPDDDAVPSSDHVTRLINAYRERGLKPRLEYLPLAAPAVEASLSAAGFSVEGRLPLMVADASTLKEVDLPHGIALSQPDSDDDLYSMAVVQAEAYGDPETPGPDVVAARRQAHSEGVLDLVAIDLGTEAVVGAGGCSPIRDGLAEVAGIGVALSHRRRGIATALARGLAGEAMLRGATNPWLMAAHDEGQRAYERAGFVLIGEVLHMSLQR
jgi:ribosomal protein S18 acetylase RimI-like enzyme